jgi:hypothetical protein
VKPNRRPCWEASYTNSAGQPFTIVGTATAECPVSMITVEAQEMLQLFLRANIMKEFGVTMHGGDLSKWPSKVVDAFILLYSEKKRVESMSIARERPMPAPMARGGRR